jgi:hypothetical protein
LSSSPLASSSRGGGPDSGASGNGDESDGGFSEEAVEDATDGDAASCSQPPTGAVDGGKGDLCMLTQSGTYTLTETSMLDAALCPDLTIMFVFAADAGVCPPMADCSCVASEAKCSITTIEDGLTTTQTTDYTYTATGYTGTVSSMTTDADGGVVSMCTYRVKVAKG